MSAPSPDLTTAPFTTIYFPPPSHPEESHTECVYAISLTPTYLISGSRDRSIRVWSLSTQRLVRCIETPHTAAILCVQASEEEDMIVCGSVDGTVSLWKLSEGRLVTRWRAHGESVLDLRFDGRWVVTGSKDRSVKVWDRRDLGLFSDSRDGGNAVGDENVGEEVQELTPLTTLTDANTAAINCVRLTSKHLFTGSGDRSLKVYELGSWERIRSVAAHNRGIPTLATSADETKVVTGSADRSIKVFDVGSGEEEAHLQDAHDNLVRCLTIPPGPDFDILISGSYDETVKIWKRVGEQWSEARKLKVKDALEADERVWDEEANRKPDWAFEVACDGRRIVIGNQRNIIVGWDFTN